MAADKLTEKLKSDIAQLTIDVNTIKLQGNVIADKEKKRVNNLFSLMIGMHLAAAISIGIIVYMIGHVGVV